MKKRDQPEVRKHSDNTTPLPEKEFSFISSSAKLENKNVPEEPPGNTSKALNKFMKFDKKYSNFR
jgi:hypothetical protein